jgi:hypothetical protein
MRRQCALVTSRWPSPAPTRGGPLRSGLSLRTAGGSQHRRSSGCPPTAPPCAHRTRPRAQHLVTSCPLETRPGQRWRCQYGRPHRSRVETLSRSCLPLSASSNALWNRFRSTERPPRRGLLEAPVLPRGQPAPMRLRPQRGRQALVISRSAREPCARLSERHGPSTVLDLFDPCPYS